MYSYALFLTSALDGVGCQLHALAALTSGRDPVSSVQKTRWAPGPVWRGCGKSAPLPAGIRCQDRLPELMCNSANS